MAKGRRSTRAQQRQKRQRLYVVGGVALAVVLVAAIFLLANNPTADSAYYRSVNPSQLKQVVEGGEPVLVYFHSPT